MADLVIRARRAFVDGALVPATVDICTPAPSSSAKGRQSAAAAPKKK